MYFGEKLEKIYVLYRKDHILELGVGGVSPNLSSKLPPACSHHLWNYVHILFFYIYFKF